MLTESLATYQAPTPPSRAETLGKMWERRGQMLQIVVNLILLDSGWITKLTQEKTFLSIVVVSKKMSHLSTTASITQFPSIFLSPPITFSIHSLPYMDLPSHFIALFIHSLMDA
jgi:hypothetical protein